MTIHLALPAFTIYRVLRRHDLQRLDHLDRQTGTPIRRYQRCRSGELVHVDVKKLRCIAARGGRKVHGRRARPAHKRGRGYVYLHSVIDDYSRLVYTSRSPRSRAAPPPPSGGEPRPGFGPGPTGVADAGATASALPPGNCLAHVAECNFSGLTPQFNSGVRRIAFIP